MATTTSSFGGVQNDPKNLLVQPTGQTYDAQGFSHAPQIDTRNQNGQMVTNAMKVGGASAARRQPMVPTGLVGTAAPAPAPSTVPAPASSNWGGVQNTPAPKPATPASPAANGQNTSPAFPTSGSATGGRLGDATTMQQHWDQYWNNFPVGTVDFAGGKLTRNADGTATYTNAAGKGYTYAQNTPFATVAANAPEIAALWKQDFGFGATAPAANPAAPAAEGFQQWAVTEPQTVQQQAADIVDADGVLMQQARGRAMQAMNERGLVNSSLGIQAGQEAVLDRAIQIAQQDAATNAEAAKFNAGQGNAWTLAQQELAQKASQFTRELAAKYDLAKFDAESRQALAATEREYQQQLATDKAFQDQYQMYVDALFKIDSDPELSAEAKSARKQEQLTLLKNYASIRGLNLSQYLTFSTPTTAAPAPAPAAATGLVSQADNFGD